MKKFLETILKLKFVEWIVSKFTKKSDPPSGVK